VLTATEVITYTNHSPDALTSLWIQLDQDTYRHDARSVASDEEVHGSHRGLQLDMWPSNRRTSDKGGLHRPDARLQIRLQKAAAAGGWQDPVHIRYHYTIPGSSAADVLDDDEERRDYDIAQWYRACRL